MRTTLISLVVLLACGLAMAQTTQPATASATTLPAAGAAPSATPALDAALAPAGKLTFEQRCKALYAALEAEPINTAAMKALLKDVGHISASFRGKPMKKWADGAAVVNGQICLSTQVDLNRPSVGETPAEWVDKLTAPVKAGQQMHLLKLALAPSEEVRAQRDKLLAEADKKIRAGLVELAKTYPFLAKTNWGNLDEALEGASPAGQIMIWAGHYEGHDGTKEKIEPGQAYNVLVMLRPLQWPEPPGQWQLKQLYGNLALMGQAHASANDAKLDAAMKFLVSDALAPLSQLDQSIDKTATEPLPTPAPAPPAE